ncbi:MAG: VWA domain-containing protein, partial [Pseudomonadota bacterium]
MADKKTIVERAEAKANLDTRKSPSGDISAFLKAAERVKPSPDGRGRVILALDATMSRQPTWDLAVEIQGQMFEAVSSSTPLQMQLVFFRGYGECRASDW